MVTALASVASAQGFTCDDVRALSPDQRAYYIRVYNITPAQQDQIRQRCYGSKARHAPVVADEKPTGSIARTDRDQRATQ